MKILDNPDDVDRTRIVAPLIAFNRAHVTDRDEAPVAIVLRDADGVVTGGLWAETVYDWLVIDTIFVPEADRGKGLGAQMLRAAETIAEERGLVGIWLDTFSFQARDFYIALGYEEFGAIGDHPRGATRHFLRKRFTGP